MVIFQRLYNVCLQAAAGRAAPGFLAADSFIEAVFWPIPPDVMLVPMCLARRARAFYYAALTTVSSVGGAGCGYCLGYWLYEPYLRRVLLYFNYAAAMQTAREWFAQETGLLMVFAGAFSPLPYKIVTLTAGAVAAESVRVTGDSGMLTVSLFLLVSLVGRGLRFFGVAGLVYAGGPTVDRWLRRYIEGAGWLCLGLIALYLVYRLCR